MYKTFVLPEINLNLLEGSVPLDDKKGTKHTIDKRKIENRGIVSLYIDNDNIKNDMRFNLFLKNKEDRKKYILCPDPTVIYTIRKKGKGIFYG
jgi:hypothetical protein